jgi:hypothetical protein
MTPFTRKAMLPVAALVLFINTTLFAQHADHVSAKAASAPVDDQINDRIKELRKKVADQQDKLDSLSMRVNVVFGIGGAILTIFFGAFANNAVNGMLQRTATNYPVREQVSSVSHDRSRGLDTSEDGRRRPTRSSAA